MTIFGKILIFFNLLAAGGFAYLALQDWQGRQTINAAGVRHVIIVHGIPLDDKPADPNAPKPEDPDAVPFRVPQPGGRETTTVSKQLLDAFFNIARGNPSDPNRGELISLGGGAVANQIAELKRVEGLIGGLFGDDTKSHSVKLTNLAAWTRNQPTSFEEREFILSLIAAASDPQQAADHPKHLAGLKKYLDGKFKAALDAPVPAPNTDPASQSQAVEALAKEAERVITLRRELEDLRTNKRPVAEIEAKQKEYDAAVGGWHRVSALFAELTGMRRDKRAATEIEAKEKEFDDALAAALAANPTNSETERRMRIAHLLMHLDQDSEWQKRVAVVVGLRQHARTIVAQARRFLDMVERTRQEMPPDQEKYLAQERNLLRLAIDRTDLANRQADLALRWVAQEKEEANFVGLRETQLNALKTRLAKIKAEVDELLNRQTGIEAALFEVQREVAVTLDEVYRLEQVLEAREKELLKSAPRPGN